MATLLTQAHRVSGASNCVVQARWLSMQDAFGGVRPPIDERLRTESPGLKQATDAPSVRCAITVFARIAVDPACLSDCGGRCPSSLRHRRKCSSCNLSRAAANATLKAAEDPSPAPLGDQHSAHGSALLVVDAAVRRAGVAGPCTRTDKVQVAAIQLRQECNEIVECGNLKVRRR